MKKVSTAISHRIRETLKFVDLQKMLYANAALNWKNIAWNTTQSEFKIYYKMMVIWKAQHWHGTQIHRPIKCNSDFRSTLMHVMWFLMSM